MILYISSMYLFFLHDHFILSYSGFLFIHICVQSFFSFFLNFQTSYILMFNISESKKNPLQSHLISDNHHSH